jgi:hypothetical protein
METTTATDRYLVSINPEATAAMNAADEVLRRIMMAVDDMPGVSIETVRANGRPGANIINLFVDAGRTFGASPMQAKAALIRYVRRTNR